MTRDDYERLAAIVDDEMFTDPDSNEQCVWNMAIKTAARATRRAGLSAAWAKAEAK